jgi:hypothetical protein
MVHIRKIALLILLIGTGLFTYSLLIPFYHNQVKADLLLLEANQMSMDEYYKKNDELRTHKIFFMDLGIGMIIGMTTILIFFIKNKVKTVSDLKTLKTFCKKWHVFVLLNIAGLLNVVGAAWYYIFRQLRGDYPPFADSIGIPIMAEVYALSLVLIPWNIIAQLLLVKSRLPARLFQIPDKYNWKSISWEVIFVILIIVTFIGFVKTVISGDHGFIITNLVFIYLLLTLRAGQLNQQAIDSLH